MKTSKADRRRKVEDGAALMVVHIIVMCSRSSYGVREDTYISSVSQIS